MESRLFLLSPASCSGNRARLLLQDESRFSLAQQLRSAGGAPLGSVFSFISQLYFRGKLAYARTFAAVPTDAREVLGDGVFVITTSRGLVPWDTPATVSLLREFASGDMRAANAAYRTPLLVSARRIAERLGPEDEVVLLGSVASDKYVEVLGEVFGPRLRFPRDFVGRGDMSRGGLLLRCIEERRELDYIPVMGSERHGTRPPKLEPLPRNRRPPSSRVR